jgi:hypothetical protein
MPVAYPLAYYTTAAIAVVKGFIVQALGANIKKTFTLVINKCQST